MAHFQLCDPCFEINLEHIIPSSHCYFLFALAVIILLDICTGPTELMWLIKETDYLEQVYQITLESKHFSETEQLTTGLHCFMVKYVALYSVFFLLATFLFWILLFLFLTSVVWLRLAKHLHPCSHSCTAGLKIQILGRHPGNICSFWVNDLESS